MSKAAYDFTPTGNVTNRATLDADFYDQSFFGAQQCNTGNDGIDGDHAATFTVARTYPASSPYNLLNFTSKGLNLGVVCSLDNTAAGCTQGNVYGTLLRPPVVIQKGDIVLVRMQGGNSPQYYTAPAGYGGVQTTPGPGGNPYNAPAGQVYDSNCYDENVVRRERPQRHLLPELALHALFRDKQDQLLRRLARLCLVAEE